jgi:hypothetical protein
LPQAEQIREGAGREELIQYMKATRPKNWNKKRRKSDKQEEGEEVTEKICQCHFTLIRLACLFEEISLTSSSHRSFVTQGQNDEPPSQPNDKKTITRAMNI